MRITTVIVEWLKRVRKPRTAASQVAVEVAELVTPEVDVSQVCTEVVEYFLDTPVLATQVCVEIALKPSTPPAEAGTVLVPRDCFVVTVVNPNDKKEVLLDWSRWLSPGERLSSVAWSAGSELTILDAQHSHTETGATFTCAPGIATGQSYYLKCHVDTDMGRTDVRTVRVDVQSASGGASAAQGWWRV